MYMYCIFLGYIITLYVFIHNGVLNQAHGRMVHTLKCLSHLRAMKAQASLSILTVSPESSLLAYTIYDSRHARIQKVLPELGIQL